MENRKVFSDEAVADLKQRLAVCVSGMRQFSEALAAAYMQAARPAFEAMRPLIEFANSPQGQAIIRAHEQRQALVAGTGGCHCLCSKRHPDRNLCLGEVPSEDLEVIRFRSDLLGAVDVPMCRSCAGSR